MARESFLYVDVYLTLMSPFFCCCCFVIIKPFTVYLVNDYVIVHTRKKKKKILDVSGVVANWRVFNLSTIALYVRFHKHICVGCNTTHVC